MLEHIFGSKTRLKILNLFLKDPKNKYFIRQISRDTDSQLNAVRREIDNLMDIGIIIPAKNTSSKDGTAAKPITSFQNQQEAMKKYLIVNTDFVLYNELRALLMKSQLLVEEDFIKKIKNMANISVVVLTGIFVGREDAKTDMLLVGNIDKKKVLAILEKFEKALNNNIRYTIMAPTEYKYRRDVTDKFLYDVLENKKIVILDKPIEAEKPEKGGK